MYELIILRFFFFVPAFTFATVVVGIAANNIHLTKTLFKPDLTFVYRFASLALAIGLLTMVTLPVLLFAFRPKIVVDMIVLSILWVLWLASASYTSHQIASVNSWCSEFMYLAFELLPEPAFCIQAKPIQVLSFITWMFLMIYLIILIVYTSIASSRGHSVWFQSVKDTHFYTPSVDAGKIPAQQMMVQYPGNFAPQQATQGVPFQGSPMHPSSQPLPMQGPIQNLNPQGYPLQQFQTPPSNHTTSQMSSPQMSIPSIAIPQNSVPQV